MGIYVLYVHCRYICMYVCCRCFCGCCCCCCCCCCPSCCCCGYYSCCCCRYILDKYIHSHGCLHRFVADKSRALRLRRVVLHFCSGLSVCCGARCGSFLRRRRRHHRPRGIIVESCAFPSCKKLFRKSKNVKTTGLATHVKGLIIGSIFVKIYV